MTTLIIFKNYYCPIFSPIIAYTFNFFYSSTSLPFKIANISSPTDIRVYWGRSCNILFNLPRKFSYFSLFYWVFGLYIKVSSNFSSNKFPPLKEILDDFLFFLSDTLATFFGLDFSSRRPIALLSIRPVKLCIYFSWLSLSPLSAILSIL